MTQRVAITALAIACLALAGVAEYFEAHEAMAALMGLGGLLGGREWLVGSTHRAPAPHVDDIGGRP